MPALAEIHRAARRGDLETLDRCIQSGVPIDQPDAREGHTPLMHACLSTQADLKTVQWLIDHGADVNALTIPPPDPMEALDDDLQEEMRLSMANNLKEMAESMNVSAEMMKMLEETTMPGSASKFRPSPDSLLSVVAQEASFEKLELLVRSGADVTFCSDAGYTALIKAACSCREDAMRLLLDAGSPIDVVSSYGESALSRISGAGRFDLVRMLLDRGADPSPLQWTPLMLAAAVGSEQEAKTIFEAGADLSATDRGGRDTLQLAIIAGRLELAEWLIAHGAELKPRTANGTPTLELLVPADQDRSLRWLLERGFDPDLASDFGTTALMAAAEYGSVRCFKALTEASADWSATDTIGESVIQKASHPEIVRILIKGGENPAKLETEVLREFIGLGTLDDLPVTREEFEKDRCRRFGTANPEPIDSPFWNAMVRCGWNAYFANEQFGVSSFASEAVTWCHDRFGMSLTCLPDGRFVQVAGEHEDGYDPDFCIYNDVIVHDGKGGFQIFAYPSEVFPPTDFHSATLIGDAVFLIGSLSYPEQRGSKAQVMRLDTTDWSIQAVATTGDDPGWIHGHNAELVDGRIRISGGKRWVADREDLVGNSQVFEFDSETSTWQRLGEGARSN